MKAIIIQKYGGPEQLVIRELPDPQPKPGEVIVEVKAFGINHAETYMRKGEWAEAAQVSGIECVGVVKACPGDEFAVGQKVAAIMGGMGRSRNGSYADYTCAPAANVVAIESGLPWEELGAIPESYATAWICLHRNLELSAGQKLLVRGATSALGQAAVNIAVQAGAHVTATTRNPERAAKLKQLGAARVGIEGPDLSGRIPDLKGFDAILELVGNSTLLDSLAMARRGGRVCLAGFLGGLAPIASFNPLTQMPSGVQFSFFGSFVLGRPEFPLSDIPFQAIVDRAATGAYQAKPARVFRFDQIQEAHRVMESNQANGKLVVRV
jgi:NADPH:quinone reductase-like Zn-dependent oxidoreductase